MGKLMPTESFHVVVCVPGAEPHRVKVSPGTTVGQLSQAEAKVDTLVQPIAITTLTGIPLALNCPLTVAAWYVIQDGAVHTLPKCAQVHAEQCLSIDLQGTTRLQGLIRQGPLVAVDEMCFYASLVRNQGHQIQIATPLVLDEPDDQHQELASWAMQCKHEHEISPDTTEFLVPVLHMSHWSPIGLSVSDQVAVMHVPQELMQSISSIVTDECGPNEVQFKSFILPTAFAADCGFQTVNWMFAKAIGTTTPHAVSPAQADQWRVPFALKLQQEGRPGHGNCTQQIRLGGLRMCPNDDCSPNRPVPVGTSVHSTDNDSVDSHLLPLLAPVRVEHRIDTGLARGFSLGELAQLGTVTIREHQTIVMNLPHGSRVQGLLQQGSLVADDEMLYYTTLARDAGLPIDAPLVIDYSEAVCLTLQRWALNCISMNEANPSMASFAVPVLVQSHWSPLFMQVDSHEIALYAPQELRQHLSSINWGCRVTQSVQIVIVDMPHESIADCGFQTMHRLVACPADRANACPMPPAFAKHLRECFMAFVSSQHASRGQCCLMEVRLGGTIQPDQLLLQALLKQHGVHQERLGTCASSLIQQLGAEMITKVLSGPAPWKDLKAAASQSNPPIRIVLAAELDTAVKSRLATGKPMGSKANKKPATKASKPPVIPGADQIKLPDAIFAQQDGQLLPTIPLHKVEAHAQGVAVCNIQDVQHFLHLSSPLSAEGIALLILDHADPRIPTTAEHVRLPAMSACTGEPMLVSAALIQLGAKRVIRHIPTESFALEEIQTKVLKILVYKDEWPGQWTTFIQHPVRHLFDHDLMKEPSFLHSEHILDVWDRQTLDSKLARTPLAQAEVFAVLLRVTDKFADHLMPQAAVDGIYLEPRTMDGRRPDPQYHVIWMPRKTLAEVRLARSQTEQRTAIVRMGPRLGLRVDRDQAEKVHMQHRPDLMFLAGQTLRPYKVGPFPYGSTKASLSQGFKHMGWNARPVQPISQMQVTEGVFWHVMSPQEPSHWIYQMKHGDILIATLEDPKEAPVPMTSNIIASRKTLSTLAQSQQATSVDPWLANDPWQTGVTAKKSNAGATSPAVTPGHLTALEQRLAQKINASASDLKPDQMHVDQTERIDALERQVTSLTQNFSQFQQQQSKVNNQIACQLQGFEGRIDTKLEDQMQRIEALLSKKMRHE